MSESEQAAAGVAQLWSRPQHAVAYQEARAVLNAQQQRKTTLDDKALRTTRLTTVVVGALITAVKTFDLTVIEPAGFVGIGLLVVSFGAGLAVYSGAEPTLGPSADDLHWVVRTETEQWERIFLIQMGDWTRENADRLERGAVFLLISEAALLVGLIVTLLAIVI